MAARIRYIPNRVIDTNGISDGASIYVYQSGTTTPVSIYSDSGLTTPLANPYSVNAGAPVPEIFSSTPVASLRVRVVSAGGDVISDDDPYDPPANAADLASTDSDKGAALIGWFADFPDAEGRALAEKLKDSVSVKDFGAKGDDAVTDDTDAFNKALDAGAKWVMTPAGIYKTSDTLIIPNNTSLVGQGMGHGSNGRTTIKHYGTAGAAVELQGFYTELAGLFLYYQGSDKGDVVGVKYGLNGGLSGSITRTNLHDMTIMGFGAGIQNAKVQTSFTHLHRNVYVKDCTIGADFQYVNNAVFDACFFESNGDNFVIDTFNNIIICNGSVIEIFGDERLSETLSSVCFKLSNGRNFTCRDSYFEVGTQLSSGGSAMKIAELTTVRGFVFDANYSNRSSQNQAPMILIKDGNCSSVSVTNNMILRGPSSGVDYLVAGDTGFENEPFKFNVWNNAVKSSSSSAALLEKRIEFTPELTEAGSAIDGIGYSVQEATCILSGNMCTVNGKIVLNALGSPGSGVLRMTIPVKSRSFLGADNEQIGQFNCANISVVTSAGICLLESGSDQLIFYRPDIVTTIKANNLVSNTTIRFNITFPIDVQGIG